MGFYGCLEDKATAVIDPWKKKGGERCESRQDQSPCAKLTAFQTPRILTTHSCRILGKTILLGLGYQRGMKFGESIFFFLFLAGHMGGKSALTGVRICV